MKTSWRSPDGKLIPLSLHRPHAAGVSALAIALNLGDHKEPAPATAPALRFCFTTPGIPSDALHFRFGDASPHGPDESGMHSSGHIIAWSALRTKNKNDSINWSKLRPLCVNIRPAWQDSPARQTGLDLPFSPLTRIQSSRTISFCKAQAANTTLIPGPWRAFPKRDSNPYRMPWQSGRGGPYPYIHALCPSPPCKEAGMLAPWSLFYQYNQQFNYIWRNPPARQGPHSCPWGPMDYERQCQRAYQPASGTQLGHNLFFSLSLVGDKNAISLFFYQYVYSRHCTRRPPSGWRDAYFYQERPLVPAAETRRYYYVLNTVLLTRLPDGAPIETLELRLRADLDSFCWQMQARLASAEALQLLRASESPDQPMLVEARLNGWQWLFNVDTWSEQRRFGSAERRVSGRSRSAVLAAPSAHLINLSPQQDHSAQQLALAALEAAAIAENAKNPISWQLDWQIVDWLVPGGLYSVAGVTAMETIRDIASAAHGLVQSHPYKDKLLILPRYAMPPWQWSLDTVDILVPESMLLAMEEKRDARPQYNAVFISGTTSGGISAKVSREGTAGDRSGPMFTHPLITAEEVARARHGHAGNIGRVAKLPS